MLVISEVSKRYNKEQVLNCCSVMLESNKIYGLLGENGAGKTTLLRLIAGIFSVDSGSILLNNQKIYENIHIKQQIYFVSDETYFPFGATLKSLKKDYMQIYPNFDGNCFDMLVQLLQLDVKKSVNDFSKGMKRQVALILGLSIDCKLLLIDESFDGLDIKTRHDFKKIIVDLMQKREMSIVISSHNLSELELLCDEIIVLENGCLEKCDSVEQLKNMIFKVNVIFKNDEILPFKILQKTQNGKINTFYVQDEEKNIHQYFEAKDVVFYEIIPCTLEEVFVLKMKGSLTDA